jgi:hypothetical protein
MQQLRHHSSFAVIMRAYEEEKGCIKHNIFTTVMVEKVPNKNTRSGLHSAANVTLLLIVVENV